MDKQELQEHIRVMKSMVAELGRDNYVVKVDSGWVIKTLQLLVTAEQQNAAMKETLEWYGDEKNYQHVESAAYSDVGLDEGYLACQVLSTIEGGIANAE